MSQSKFSVAYDGESLKNGAMDVRDLAPALLAVGELFNEANSILNGKSAEVKVNVTATGLGSFEVFLEVDLSYISQLLTLMNSDTFKSAIDLKILRFWWWRYRCCYRTHSAHKMAERRVTG